MEARPWSCFQNLFDKSDSMKIAFLHFDLSGGPQSKNLEKLKVGIELAAKAGAEWVITPEMALQGYFMTQTGHPYKLLKESGKMTIPFQELARNYGIAIFLGCGESDDMTGLAYNSCLVFSAQGDIVGRQRKIRTLNWVTEAWSAPGTILEPFVCDERKIGVLVCADAWFGDNGEKLAEAGSDAIVVVAAWPPGCGGPPEEAWKRCSARTGGLPVFVCNQTGINNGMDCTIAKSAVVYGGELVCEYSGDEAILIFDFDSFKANGGKTNFEILNGEILS